MTWSWSTLACVLTGSRWVCMTTTATIPHRLVLRRRVLLTLPEGASVTPVDLSGQPWPNVVLLNDGDVSYAKIRLDASSWAACAEGGLWTIADPLSRAVLWTGARDLVRMGSSRPGATSPWSACTCRWRDDISIVEGVLGFTRLHVIDRYLNPGERTAALTAVGNTCRAILERTGPEAASGSSSTAGLRLAAARGVIDAAVSPDDIEELRACLADDAMPGGRVLDADLRWRILLRLSVLGAVESDRIEDELARDTSGAGPEGAARCRAALPSLSTKEAAWEAMFGCRARGCRALHLSGLGNRTGLLAARAGGSSWFRLSAATFPRRWRWRRDAAPPWQRRSEPPVFPSMSSTRPP